MRRRSREIRITQLIPVAYALQGLLTLLALSSFTVSAFATQPLKLVEMKFVGNSRIAREQLFDGVTTGSPLPRVFESSAAFLLNLEQIETSLSAYYAAQGFYKMKIDSFHIALAARDTAGGFSATFFIREGPQYVIKSLTLEGANRFDPNDLLSRFQTRTGDVLNDQTLSQDINETLKLYEQNGYPFARMDVRRVIPSEIDSLSGTLAISLALDEGKRAIIGRIAVAGNTSTNSDVILRELRLPTGSYYDGVEVERARSRVERLGFFESVSDPELFLINDSTVALLIHVKEANSSVIDGVLGYNPGANPTESGYLSGYANLGFRNISGTGRNATLNYDHENQTSEQLEVKYLEPWLFRYPLNLQLNFLQRQQDSTYVLTSYGADLRLLLSEDVSIDGSIAYERVVPTILPGMAFTVFDSRILTTGLGGTLDTRDNAIAPHYGIFASLSALLGEKSINGPAQFLDAGSPSTVSLKTVGVDAAIFLPTINERFIAAVGIHARNVSSTGDTLDASDLFRIGGLRTVRGYREENFLVSRYAYANLEYRVMTGKYSFLFLFSDIGYLYRDMLKGNATEQTIQAFSYGLGAQVESPLGILTVSIGVAKGVGLDQATLSFGIVKQF